MSETEGHKQLVFNQRDQPVELHFESRVVVLPPYGQAELEEAETASPQLQAFVSQRLVSVREKESNEEDAPRSPESDTAAGVGEQPATDTEATADASGAGVASGTEGVNAERAQSDDAASRSNAKPRRQGNDKTA
ncbi:MAG: hypothetical protein LC803_22565 [Acidobacteria bacterium]|nr:hypothetical protein [Acidobacteriota bacterium]